MRAPERRFCEMEDCDQEPVEKVEGGSYCQGHYDELVEDAIRHEEDKREGF